MYRPDDAVLSRSNTLATPTIFFRIDMTTNTPPDAVQMPPLPAVSFFGDDISYGYDREDMHAYAQAHADQRTTELEARLAVADARFIKLADEAENVLDKFERSEALPFSKRIALSLLRAALTPKEHQ